MFPSPPHPLSLPAAAGGYTPGLPDHASQEVKDLSAMGVMSLFFSGSCRGYPRTPRPCFSRNKGFVSYGAWGGDPRAGICVHFLPHHWERMEQGNASVASRRLRPARVCLRSLNCEPVRISSKMRMIRMQALAGEDGYPAGIRSRCRGGTFPPCHSCRYCPVIVGMTGLS